MQYKFPSRSIDFFRSSIVKHLLDSWFSLNISATHKTVQTNFGYSSTRHISIENVLKLSKYSKTLGGKGLKIKVNWKN